MANVQQVVALEPGHDGRVYRNVGERFSVDLDDPRYNGATWFVAPEKVPEPKPKPKSVRPPGAGPVKGSAIVEEAAPGAPNPDAGSGTF